MAAADGGTLRSVCGTWHRQRYVVWCVIRSFFAVSINGAKNTHTHETVHLSSIPTAVFDRDSVFLFIRHV